MKFAFPLCLSIIIHTLTIAIHHTALSPIASNHLATMGTIILGSQWGDEGKGKLTDRLLSELSFDVCARATGGHNAGHSVRTGGQTYDFHLLPSGLINPNTDNLIGSGVVFSSYFPSSQLRAPKHAPSESIVLIWTNTTDVEAFFKELTQLESQGVPRLHTRIHVSSRCHLNFTLHSAVDGISEEELGMNQIGTVRAECVSGANGGPFPSISLTTPLPPWRNNADSEVYRPKEVSAQHIQRRLLETG